MKLIVFICLFIGAVQGANAQSTHSQNMNSPSRHSNKVNTFEIPRSNVVDIKDPHSARVYQIASFVPT